MSYAEFQERYEQDGEAEYRRYLAMPTPALLDAVRAGRFGDQHQLWSAIAAKATLAEAGWPLFGVVSGDAPYLDRYHAAAALLALLQSDRYGPVDLAGAPPRRQECVAAVEQDLRARLGPPPTGAGRGA